MRVLHWATPIALCSFIICGIAMTQPFPPVDKSANNLMVVLRESIGGAPKEDEALVPMGKYVATLPDGRRIESEMAAFRFIGDMHIRFVFDGPNAMQVASPEDLIRLDLTPEQALALAMTNIKRVYGRPIAVPWTAGLMQVKGRSPDLDSSYFLDREFWRAQLKDHPEGLVVSVAKRGGLLFAPLSDTRTVDGLRRGVGYLFTSSENLRVSSALYLFKDDRWTIFQAPLPAREH